MPFIGVIRQSPARDVFIAPPPLLPLLSLPFQYGKRGGGWLDALNNVISFQKPSPFTVFDNNFVITFLRTLERPNIYSESKKDEKRYYRTAHIKFNEALSAPNQLKQDRRLTKMYKKGTGIYFRLNRPSSGAGVLKLRYMYHYQWYNL
jgi:hypothetical protein